MRTTERRDLEKRLLSFVGPLLSGVGRIERRTALSQYVMGLLLEGERKSLQPMAERLSPTPEEADALRQRMQQAVGTARWPDADVRQRLAAILLAELPDLEAYVIDDTGFPKKGRWSPGVARQYSETLGRVDNCQTAVSLHLAGAQGSAAIAMRLFLPEAWDADETRRHRAQIPEDVHHQPKWQMALAQLDEALSWGVPHFVTLADSGFGTGQAFRTGLRERGLPYVMRIESQVGVWADPARTTTPSRSWSSSCAVEGWR